MRGKGELVGGETCSFMSTILSLTALRGWRDVTACGRGAASGSGEVEARETNQWAVPGKTLSRAFFPNRALEACS